MRGPLTHRARPEPPLDVGLAAERTGMAWQRTGLALAAFSALLVRLADRDLVLASPGLAGMALGLALVVLGERRYSRVLDRVSGGASCMDHRLVGLLTLGAVILAVASLALVAAVDT